MFDWGFYALTMRQAYRDRLREAEESRLLRQARAGQGRPSRLLARIRAWLEGWLPAPLLGWPGHGHSAVKKAAMDSKAGGSLIL